MTTSDGVAAVGVVTPIEGHHFTPFASLLYQLPQAVRTVFGNDETTFYWGYNARNKCLDLDVYWIKSGEPFNTARRLTCVSFERTAYSYNEIVGLLSIKKVDNTSTIGNV